MSSIEVELWDDSKHEVKGVGEAFYQLDSSSSISIEYVLLVKYFKNNILYIYALGECCFIVAFADG